MGRALNPSERIPVCLQQLFQPSWCIPSALEQMHRQSCYLPKISSRFNDTGAVST